ncbi:hypothetical protein [Nostoc sp. 'Peltigera malacea cyanobiont' DB3992]|uniref:hypothetical protein n=1 Tax=Nostoc sp. 'Peltigera malacea cyanobiont' DB3992 TaxID=1206980 RepID=UPI0015D4B989|nr:hypothetical protein [Nostoc sp. 'Peltigera malacea cyanobiont' DB3992]
MVKRKNSGDDVGFKKQFDKLKYKSPSPRSVQMISEEPAPLPEVELTDDAIRSLHQDLH